MREINFTNQNEMVRRIKEKYHNSTYAKTILNHMDEMPLKDDIKSIIACLRRMFPSTYDFRSAKAFYNVYGHNRLETKCLALLMREEYEKFTLQKKDEWKKAELAKYNCSTWQEYFEICGWKKRDGSNSYIKPKIDRDATKPNVLEPTFHRVLNHHANRVGYRGKKNEIQEQNVRNRRAEIVRK